MLNFLCPNCKQPLVENGSCASCENGHCYDKAKEGYYHLLSKHSKAPGDNIEMVRARRDFLDEEFYLPLAEQIANVINEHFSEPITLLDAGVGTGFYLSKIINSRNNTQDVYLAVDVSKHAVKIASKRNKQAQCAVASVYSLPIADNSVDVVVCVFSPFAMAEYERVLKSGGLLIIAYPHDNHLIELRNALYENVRSNETVLPQNSFENLEEKQVCYEFLLENSNAICDLLTMTPYVYRAPKDAVERVKAQNKLSLTADFHLSVLKKR